MKSSMYSDCGIYNSPKLGASNDKIHWIYVDLHLPLDYLRKVYNCTAVEHLQFELLYHLQYSTAVQLPPTRAMLSFSPAFSVHFNTSFTPPSYV